MVFSSTIFLFLFLPALLFIYYFAPSKLKNLVLLLASLLFYAWGEPKNVFLMLLSILLNYVLGRLIECIPRYRKLFLIIAAGYDLGMLFLFKYLNFAGSIWESLTGIGLNIAQIALPIGISFYTFQILSYVIDVYRGDVKAQRNPLDLALYVSLFPQLIAGPIVRYSDVEEQLHQRSVNLDSLYNGVFRFCVGFSKKILIADQLSKLVDTVFSGQYPSLYLHWVGIIAYTLQIYFDFSGYSDMAIGLGKMFGFAFLENFNYPYISQSVQEFWRRWHISLGSWFRDYLYIPLGGSRRGTARTYLNLIIVFFLTGLWHGASYNFIVWGVYYAIFLIVERLGFNKTLKKLPRLLRHLYAILVILIGWIFFRADTLGDAVRYISGMFTLFGMDAANFNFVMNGQYWFCLAAGIFFSFPHTKTQEYFKRSKGRVLVADLAVLLVFIVAISYMLGSGFSPFLYFRF